MLFETCDKWATAIVITLLVVAIVLFTSVDHVVQCTQYATVVDIVSAKYRGIEVLLSNGMVKSIDQPTELITDGYKLCLQYQK